MKSLHDKGLRKVIEFSDDVTVVNGSETEPKQISQKMLVMFMTPDKDKGIDDNEAPLKAIWAMNQMIKCLINKIPSVRFGP